MPSVVLIANPAAGHGRAPRIATELARQLSARGTDAAIITPRSPRATVEAAAAAATAGATVVGAVGGDGTLHHVAGGLLAAQAEQCALLPVPTGRGNDLARALGQRRWTDSIELLLHGRRRLIDVLRVSWDDGRTDVAINAASAGLDAEIAALVASGPRLPGPAAYLLPSLRGLAGLHHRAWRLTLDGTILEGRFLFVSVSNGPFYGGGMHVAPAACLDDGLLDAGLAGPISRLDALRTLPKLYRGTHLGHPLFQTLQGRSLTIEGEAAPVQLDGEPASPTPLNISVEPRALAVLTSARDQDEAARP